MRAYDKEVVGCRTLVMNANMNGNQLSSQFSRISV